MSRRSKGALALVVAALVIRAHGCGDGEPSRVKVATFNIENYPKSAEQVPAVFALIASLDVSAVGVQEITEPGQFARDARAYLGPSWRFVYCEPCPEQRVGVLYDANDLDLLTTRSHDELVTYPGAKPAFEARLRHPGGDVVRLIVVHLKSGGAHVETRRRQLRALGQILGPDRSSEQILVLGDFNTTSAADREGLDQLAGETGLTWASRDLECTSFWKRRQACTGTALDHVFTSAEPAGVAAHGACESHGCDPGTICPRYVRDVSDHCPVTVEVGR